MNEVKSPRASAGGIFTASVKPAKAYPPYAEASADTLFAFIPALPDGAFCEGV